MDIPFVGQNCGHAVLEHPAHTGQAVRPRRIIVFHHALSAFLHPADRVEQAAQRLGGDRAPACSVTSGPVWRRSGTCGTRPTAGDGLTALRNVTSDHRRVGVATVRYTGGGLPMGFVPRAQDLHSSSSAISHLDRCQPGYAKWGLGGDSLRYPGASGEQGEDLRDCERR